MAITRIASQNATGTGTSSATAVYAVTPTVGDLLVAIIANTSDGSQAETAPSGWIQAVTGSIGTATGSVFIYYKIAGASEPTSVTFSNTITLTYDLLIYEYTGNATANVLDQAISNTSALSGSSLIANTGTTSTTTQASEMGIAMGAWITGTQTLSAWTNYTAVNSVGSKTFVAEKFLTVSGTQNATVTVTGSSLPWGAALATFKAFVPSKGNLTILGAG